MQRRVVLFDSQKDSEPDTLGVNELATTQSPKTSERQRPTLHKQKTPRGTPPKREKSKSPKMKSPNSSKKKGLEKKLTMDSDLREAMKQLIIDRQILSSKNIADEMSEMEKLEQQNMLAEHFETLRTYEFSPSLQA